MYSFIKKATTVVPGSSTAVPHHSTNNVAEEEAEPLVMPVQDVAAEQAFDSAHRADAGESHWDGYAATIPIHMDEDGTAYPSVAGQGEAATYGDAMMNVQAGEEAPGGADGSDMPVVGGVAAPYGEAAGAAMSSDALQPPPEDADVTAVLSYYRELLSRHTIVPPRHWREIRFDLPSTVAELHLFPQAPEVVQDREPIKPSPCVVIDLQGMLPEGMTTSDYATQMVQYVLDLLQYQNASTAMTTLRFVKRGTELDQMVLTFAKDIQLATTILTELQVAGLRAYYGAPIHDYPPNATFLVTDYRRTLHGGRGFSVDDVNLLLRPLRERATVDINVIEGYEPGVFYAPVKRPETVYSFLWNPYCSYVVQADLFRRYGVLITMAHCPHAFLKKGVPYYMQKQEMEKRLREGLQQHTNEVAESINAKRGLKGKAARPDGTRMDAYADEATSEEDGEGYGEKDDVEVPSSWAADAVQEVSIFSAHLPDDESTALGTSQASSWQSQRGTESRAPATQMLGRGGYGPTGRPAHVSALADDSEIAKMEALLEQYRVKAPATSGKQTIAATTARNSTNRSRPSTTVIQPDSALPQAPAMYYPPYGYDGPAPSSAYPLLVDQEEEAPPVSTVPNALSEYAGLPYPADGVAPGGHYAPEASVQHGQPPHHLHPEEMNGNVYGGTAVGEAHGLGGGEPLLSWDMGNNGMPYHQGGGPSGHDGLAGVASYMEGGVLTDSAALMPPPPPPEHLWYDRPPQEGFYSDAGANLMPPTFMEGTTGQPMYPYDSYDPMGSYYYAPQAPPSAMAYGPDQGYYAYPVLPPSETPMYEGYPPYPYPMQQGVGDLGDGAVMPTEPPPPDVYASPPPQLSVSPYVTEAAQLAAEVVQQVQSAFPTTIDSAAPHEVPAGVGDVCLLASIPASTAAAAMPSVSLPTAAVDHLLRYLQRNLGPIGRLLNNTFTSTEAEAAEVADSRHEVLKALLVNMARGAEEEARLDWTVREWAIPATAAASEVTTEAVKAVQLPALLPYLLATPHGIDLSMLMALHFPIAFGIVAAAYSPAFLLDEKVVRAVLMTAIKADPTATNPFVRHVLAHWSPLVEWLQDFVNAKAAEKDASDGQTAKQLMTIANSTMDMLLGALSPEQRAACAENSRQYKYEKRFVTRVGDGSNAADVLWGADGSALRSLLRLYLHCDACDGRIMAEELFSARQSNSNDTCRISVVTLTRDHYFFALVLLSKSQTAPVLSVETAAFCGSFLRLIEEQLTASTAAAATPSSKVDAPLLGKAEAEQLLDSAMGFLQTRDAYVALRGAYLHTTKSCTRFDTILARLSAVDPPSSISFATYAAWYDAQQSGNRSADAPAIPRMFAYQSPRRQRSLADEGGATSEGRAAPASTTRWRAEWTAVLRNYPATGTPFTPLPTGWTTMLSRSYGHYYFKPASGSPTYRHPGDAIEYMTSPQAFLQEPGATATLADVVARANALQAEDAAAAAAPAPPQQTLDDAKAWLQDQRVRRYYLDIATLDLLKVSYRVSNNNSSSAHNSGGTQRAAGMKRGRGAAVDPVKVQETLALVMAHATYPAVGPPFPSLRKGWSMYLNAVKGLYSFRRPHGGEVALLHPQTQRRYYATPQAFVEQRHINLLVLQKDCANHGVTVEMEEVENWMRNQRHRHEAIDAAVVRIVPLDYDVSIAEEDLEERKSKGSGRPRTEQGSRVDGDLESRDRPPSDEDRDGREARYRRRGEDSDRRGGRRDDNYPSRFRGHRR